MTGHFPLPNANVCTVFVSMNSMASVLDSFVVLHQPLDHLFMRIDESSCFTDSDDCAGVVRICEDEHVVIFILSTPLLQFFKILKLFHCYRPL